jgi:hypothetical protein
MQLMVFPPVLWVEQWFPLLLLPSALLPQFLLEALEVLIDFKGFVFDAINGINVYDPLPL